LDRFLEATLIYVKASAGPDADATRVPLNSKLAMAVETDRSRIVPLVARRSTNCHVVGIPIRILVERREAPSACGKIGQRKSGFIRQLG
jgi:hypothetical protein